MQQSAPSQEGNSEPDEEGSMYDADSMSSEGAESESSEDDFDGLSDGNADKSSRRRTDGKGGQPSRKQRPRAKRFAVRSASKYVGMLHTHGRWRTQAYAGFVD